MSELAHAPKHDQSTYALAGPHELVLTHAVEGDQLLIRASGVDQPLLVITVTDAGVAPIAKLPAGVGTAFDAVSWMVSVLPSGRLNFRLIWSPLFGLARAVGGRLFFAGEATSPNFFSTAHGARDSGERAAREALATSLNK